MKLIELNKKLLTLLSIVIIVVLMHSTCLQNERVLFFLKMPITLQIIWSLHAPLRVHGRLYKQDLLIYRLIDVALIGNLSDDLFLSLTLYCLLRTKMHELAKFHF